ncbi:MAG TPA: efflux RND transporter periplasmic adaptor subunit [Telluria sp.]|jgi:multidrug efflux system membrane fusion protein
MKTNRKLFLGLFLLLVAGAGVGLGYRMLPRAEAAKPAKAGATVLVALAERRDVPLTLHALGTVQPMNTVAVRTQVEGQLVSVEFNEGQVVRQGQVLARIDPLPLQAQVRAASARRAADSALLANAEQDLKRQREMLAGGFISAQALEAKHAQLALLKANVDADQAQLDIAQLQLTHATIRAPIGGRVGARLVDAGNVVRPDSGPLVQIHQVMPVVVSFTLAAEELPAIRARQAGGALPVLAASRAGQALAQGSLTLIDHQIDQASATAHFKASFANRDEALWPGQFVNVELQLGARSGAIVVPPSAVQAGPAGRYVYVVRDGKKVERRAVTLLASEPAWAVVGSGLAAGESVVVDGQQKLDEGTKVQVIMAPAAAKGGAS